MYKLIFIDYWEQSWVNYTLGHYLNSHHRSNPIFDNLSLKVSRSVTPFDFDATDIELILNEDEALYLACVLQENLNSFPKLATLHNRLQVLPQSVLCEAA